MHKLDSKNKVLEAARLALEKKAGDPVILDIKKLSSVADYLLISSAGSERQVQAISTFVIEGLSKRGEKALGVEGTAEGRWVLIDFNDVVVHIFLKEVREFYDIEGLWAEAPRVALEEGPSKEREKTHLGGP